MTHSRLYATKDNEGSFADLFFPWRSAIWYRLYVLFFWNSIRATPSVYEADMRAGGVL